MASLQEQLLKAGVVDDKKAKQISKEKRKAKKQAKGKAVVDSGPSAADLARAEKAEKDRELNRQRQAEADRKALQAQIAQLISVNAIDRKAGDVAYQFVDAKKIKKIHVTPEQQAQLTRGQIAIVTLAERYELVPAVVAEKIAQRDSARVLLMHDKSAKQEVDEEDPYADYQIPDDLMW